MGVDVSARSLGGRWMDGLNVDVAYHEADCVHE